MVFFDETYFNGKWEIINPPRSTQGSLSIEKTQETFKCVWSLDVAPKQDYFGIGMLVGRKLYVSRFIQQDTGNCLMPLGGVCTYKPIGDQRSLAVLWAGTDNFYSLGSGIAIRRERSESFEGSYEVRYFLRENEDRFELKIKHAKSKNLYSLNWARKEQPLLHGIGMIMDGQMVIAWGELTVKWEVMILEFENKEGFSLLKCKRVAQRSNLVCEEVFERSESTMHTDGRYAVY